MGQRVGDMSQPWPACLDIEAALLGCLLIDNETRYIIENLSADMFYEAKNMKIFKVIKTFHQDKRKIDIITVSAELQELATYITQLTARIGSTAHVGEYAAVVIQKYIQREIIKRSYQLISKQFEDQDIEDSLKDLEAIARHVSEIISGKFVLNSIHDLIGESIEKFNERVEARQKGKRPGIPIPFYKLQETLGGWQPGNLVYIAGRPSTGKTAISIFLAKEAARAGFEALFFSLEMTDHEITDRIISAETGISPVSWTTGKAGNLELSNVESLKQEFTEMPLYILDCSCLKASHVNAICRKKKPDIIFIDFIQLMKPERDLHSRNLELGEISHRLKLTAKEFRIPIIAMCQLNREVERRMDKKPYMSDMRDSGELEQDADIVLLLYRRDIEAGQTNILEINLAKNRNGPTGTFQISYNEYMNQFKELAENEITTDVF